MTAAEFQTFADAFFDSIRAIICTKGHDYTADLGDRLGNFKDAARALGLSPMQVWAVYFNKHVTAVLNFAARGRVESEAVHDRFLDIATYAILGAALAAECA